MGAWMGPMKMFLCCWGVLLLGCGEVQDRNPESSGTDPETGDSENFDDTDVAPNTDTYTDADTATDTGGVIFGSSVTLDDEDLLKIGTVTPSATYVSGIFPTVAEETSLTLGGGDRAIQYTLPPDATKREYAAKFDDSGTLVWASVLLVDQPYDNAVIQELLPVDENLYVTGRIYQNASVESENGDGGFACLQEECDGMLFFMRYDAEGHIEWTRTIANATGNGAALSPDGSHLTTFMTSVEVSVPTGDGDVVVLGPTDTPYLWVWAKYDESGTLVSLRRIAIRGTAEPIFLPDGSALYYGAYEGQASFEGTDGNTVLDPDGASFVARYDADGELVFAKPSIGSYWGARLSGDRLVMSELLSDNVSIDQGDSLFNFQVEDGYRTVAAMVYGMDGTVLFSGPIAYAAEGSETYSLEGTDVHVLGERPVSNGRDFVLRCGGPMHLEPGGGSDRTMIEIPAGDYAVVAVRVDYAGELLDFTVLATGTMLDYHAPWVDVTVDEETVFVSASHWRTLIFGDGETEAIEPEAHRFGTALATFDVDFALSSIHHYRTVQEAVLSDAERRIHAVDSRGFIRLDDLVNIWDGARYAVEASDGSSKWSAAAGGTDSMVLSADDSIVVLTSDLGKTIRIGNDDTVETLPPPSHTRRTYWASLNASNGDLVAAAPIVSVTSAHLDGLGIMDSPQCTDEALSMAEAARFRNPPPQDALNRLLWQDAKDSVDAESVSLCDVADDCLIVADRMTADGTTVRLAYSDEVEFRKYGFVNTLSLELSVSRDDTSDMWSAISLSDASAVEYYYGTVERRSGVYSAEWSGPVADGVPADGSLAWTSGTESSDVGNGRSGALTIGSCDISWRSWSSSDWGDIFRGTVESESLKINDNRYEMTAVDDPSNYNGFINGECVGKIAPETSNPPPGLKVVRPWNSAAEGRFRVLTL